ncbi:MAG TPA: DUF2231 domain-containing protein [Gemmatimonadales bacterium]|nr:DUF2231 domain-containing protein [Gemmatimonadales bacterium]
MNLVHVHLMLTHVPVLGVLFGTLVLLAAVPRRNDTLRRTALVVFVIAGIAAWATYLTGEPAEHAVEHVPGISEAIIDRHEDAALVATIGATILGLIALAGLVLYRAGRAIANGFAGLSLVAGIAVTALMIWTANLGGQIRHPEIRSGAQVVAPADSPDRD